MSVKYAITRDKNSRWMSKEPAEIFERAADDGFINQVRYCQYLFANNPHRVS